MREVSRPGLMNKAFFFLCVVTLSLVGENMELYVSWALFALDLTNNVSFSSLSVFSILVANPYKLLDTVVTPAYGLLSREKKTKNITWQRTPLNSPPPLKEQHHLLVRRKNNGIEKKTQSAYNKATNV